jgi:hypothetical protein
MTCESMSSVALSTRCPYSAKIAQASLKVAACRPRSFRAAMRCDTSKSVFPALLRYSGLFPLDGHPATLARHGFRQVGGTNGTGCHAWRPSDTSKYAASTKVSNDNWCLPLRVCAWLSGSLEGFREAAYTSARPLGHAAGNAALLRWQAVLISFLDLGISLALAGLDYATSLLKTWQQTLGRRLC